MQKARRLSCAITSTSLPARFGLSSVEKPPSEGMLEVGGRKSFGSSVGTDLSEELGKGPGSGQDIGQ